MTLYVICVDFLAAEEPSGDGDFALLYALRNAASLTVTQLILDTHPGAVSTPSPDGDLPLHVALQYGAESDVIDRLIDLFPEGWCHVSIVFTLNFSFLLSIIILVIVVIYLQLARHLMKIAIFHYTWHFRTMRL